MAPAAAAAAGQAAGVHPADASADEGMAVGEYPAPTFSGSHQLVMQPDRVTFWESLIHRGDLRAHDALQGLLRWGKARGYVERVHQALLKLPTAMIERQIARGLPDDPTTADRLVRLLGGLAAAGSPAALDCLQRLSLHATPVYYILGASQLAELALQSILLPPEVEALMSDSSPRLIPFLHVWAVRRPKTLRLNPDALVRVAAREGMVSADMIYIVGVWAREAPDRAGPLIQRLLPYAGSERNRLQQMAVAHSAVGRMLDRDPNPRHRTTQIDVQGGREAAFAKAALATPDTVKIGELGHLANAAHSGVPLALEALFGIAKESGDRGKLARDLLNLLARNTDYAHQNTAQIMMGTLISPQSAK